MRKKFFSQLVIFFLLFITWCELQNLQSASTMSRISGPLPVFPNIQIELLKSQDPAVSADVLMTTAQSLLQYIKPNLTGEPCQAQFLFLNILGDDDPEVVISISLLPDNGILALLQKQKGYYILLYYLDNLLPIAKIDKLSFPGRRDILLTREDHNEITGAYSESRTVSLWGWEQKKLQVLWNEHCFWEMNFLSTWQDPNTSSRNWIKLTQNLTFSYQTSPSARVLVEGTQTYEEAPAPNNTLPAPHLFTPRASREVKETYQWNEEWQKFILHTGTLSIPGSPDLKVAVLKDLSSHLESMFVKEEKYQVITSEDKIMQIEKKHLKLDP